MNQLTKYRREIALPGLWHDYANLFPMLDATGQDALRADIQLHGVREPVILFCDRILDGRNRYMAARDLGMDFPVVDFDGTDAEALSYVLSTNLHRRHLTESQRAAVAAKLANMTHGGDRKSDQAANLQDDRAPVTQAQAADMLNVSERSVATAKKVIEQGAPELVAAVESGAVSVSAAASVAELPADEQAAVVAAGPKAVKDKAKKVKADKKADPEAATIDSEVAKVMRELAKMTAEGVAGLVIEVRAALADEKAKAKAVKAERDALKSQLADLTSDDKDTVIRRLTASLKNAENAKWRATEEQGRIQKQVYALKKRVEELEGMEIPL